MLTLRKAVGLRLCRLPILFAIWFLPVRGAEPGSVPNPSLTPGTTLEVTREDICTTGYTRKVRNVPVAVKRRSFDLYRITYIPKSYEVDHLIPLEIGGSNSIKNLWPEPYDVLWGARVKDALENKLHTMVCRGDVPLPEAQHEIATDWISAYKRYFRTEEPIHVRSGRRKVRKSY